MDETGIGGMFSVRPAVKVDIVGKSLSKKGEKVVLSVRLAETLSSHHGQMQHIVQAPVGNGTTGGASRKGQRKKPESDDGDNRIKRRRRNYYEREEEI